MLTTQQFNERCASLYRGMKSTFKERNWKSGKRAGTVRVPGRELPFDLEDLRRHLGKRIGLNAKPCTYCGTPIDIRNLSLDHQEPVSRGGSLALDNLIECCADCNRLKGALTAEEFGLLLEFLRTLPPAAQTDLRRRLNAGAMGVRNRFFARDKAPNTAQTARVPRYRTPQLEIDEATF
ncbi:MAG: HNH endonuclease [Acidobacteriaceae bacterium]|jgi:hypothetical protein